MDALELVPGAGGLVDSRRVHERFTTASSSNQSYSHITASGSSRVQNGNNYYITYDYFTAHDHLPMLPSNQQAAVEQVSRPSQKRKRSVSDNSKATHNSRERQTLATALESLGQYSKSMQQQSQGKQSTRIAAQLTIILESFEQAVPNDEKTEDLDGQLRDLEDQLRRARHIKINAISPRVRASGQQYKAQTKLTRITWGQWEISLSAKTLQSQSVDGDMLTETCSALNVQHAVGSRGPCIAAYFRESTDFDRTETMHPIVLAYNQVNSGAQVFKLVEEDDLDGLMRFLALGQASIRDCDEAGRSLLHYACNHASVKVCKFLVDSGCDVDLAAVAFYADELRDTPLHCSHSSEADLNEDELEQLLLCRKHLLQAGADPTIASVDINGSGYPRSAIAKALDQADGGYRTTKPFKQILHEGFAYFDVRSFRIADYSLWLYACSLVSELSSPEILQVLVEAGANVAEVDGNGWNCLFRCAIHSSTPSNSADFEALTYLLTVSDDIYARDIDGFSIFNLLYFSAHVWPEELGSYKEDLWYCALYRTGLAQRFGIDPPPSPPVFTSEYTVDNYFALLCLDAWDFGPRNQHTADCSWLHVESLPWREGQSAFSLREWDSSDLLMMKKRIDTAVFVTDDDEHDNENDDHQNELPAAQDVLHDSSDEWETESEEDGGD